MTEALPTLNPEAVQPTIEDVSLLERTRTVGYRTNLGGDTTSADVTLFNDQTRPTETEVGQLISMATEAILAQLPPQVSPAFYPRITHAVALYTAILIEGSFFREDLDRGSAGLYQRLLDVQMGSLLEDTAASSVGTRGVDSPVMIAGREEDPYYLPTIYPPPPPS